MLKNIAAVDIGNSRIKMLFENEYTFSNYDEGWLYQVKNFFESFQMKRIKIVYSSVNNQMEFLFKKFLSKTRNLEFESIAQHLERQRIIDFSNIEGIGSDRVLGLFGALNYCEPPFITIDCGTAVTINVLDVNKKCRGGAIFAGMQLQNTSLAKATAGLKEIDLDFNTQGAGKSTTQAIQIGIVTGTAGAVKEIVTKIISQEFNNQKVPLYFTGGNSELVMKALEGWGFDMRFNDRLVIDGILKIMN